MVGFPLPLQPKSHTLSAHLLNYGARRFDSRVHNLIFYLNSCKGQKKEQPTNRTNTQVGRARRKEAVASFDPFFVPGLRRRLLPLRSDRKIETRRWKRSKVVNNGTNHVERVKFRWDFPCRTFGMCVKFSRNTLEFPGFGQIGWWKNL